jgi:hypothetical protein
VRCANRGIPLEGPVLIKGAAFITDVIGIDPNAQQRPASILARNAAGTNLPHCKSGASEMNKILAPSLLFLSGIDAAEFSPRRMTESTSRSGGIGSRLTNLVSK